MSAVAGRPGTGRLLAAQLHVAVVALWRARVVAVVTLVVPIVWLVVIGLVAGNAVLDPATGVRVMQYVTPTAAAMGILYGAYPTVAIALTEARERGVLRRVRGTPLPAWAYLAGQLGAAALFAGVAVLLALAVGVLAYDVQLVGRTVPATVATVVLGVTCFAAVGTAVAALAPSLAVAQGASIGTAVALTFVSGLFTVGAEQPAVLRAVGAAFPLQPLAEAMRAQLDPADPRAGWTAGGLAVVLAWTVVAGAVAVRWFRWEPRRPGGRSAPGVQARVTGRQPRHGGPSEVAVPRPARAPVAVEVGRPAARVLVAAQAGAALRSTLRDGGSVFFAVVMPVGLYAFLVGSQPRDLEVAGVPFAVWFAAGMVAWGAAVTAVVNVPEQVATARDRGVLRRLRGTPLPAAHYLAGRGLGALATALAVGVGVLAVAAGAFGARPTPAGVLLAVGVLGLGTASLLACGLAIASRLPSARAVSAVSLVVLLPLAFFSDVFVAGGPAWMTDVGALFPLLHVQHALVASLDPAGARVVWLDLAVLVAWGIGAGAIAVRTFRWGAHDGG